MPIARSDPRSFLLCSTRRSTRQRHVTIMSKPSSKSWPPCRNLSHVHRPCVMGMVRSSMDTMRRRMRPRHTEDRTMWSNALMRVQAAMGNGITLVWTVGFSKETIGRFRMRENGRLRVAEVKHRSPRGGVGIGKCDFFFTSILRCRCGGGGRRGCRFPFPCCRLAGRLCRSRGLLLAGHPGGRVASGRDGRGGLRCDRCRC